MTATSALTPNVKKFQTDFVFISYLAFFFLPLLFLRLRASSICDSTRKKKSARWTLPPLVHLCILYIDLSAKALVVKEMAHLKNSTLAYREKPIRSVLAIGGLAATSCLNDFSQNLVGLFYMN
jgi:hypothetical protein